MARKFKVGDRVRIACEWDESHGMIGTVKEANPGCDPWIELDEPGFNTGKYSLQYEDAVSPVYLKLVK